MEASNTRREDETRGRRPASSPPPSSFVPQEERESVPHPKRIPMRSYVAPPLPARNERERAGERGFLLPSRSHIDIMNTSSLLIRSLAIATLLSGPILAADLHLAAVAVNELGLDLHRRLARGDANLCLSPYSIQTALALAYAGAEGKTREEMAQVLHYPQDDSALQASFADIRHSLEAMTAATTERAAKLKDRGGSGEPVTLTVANRLFGQSGYGFRAPFLALLKDTQEAPFETLDFIKDAAGATRHINGWVGEQTHQRIPNLIPEGGLDHRTRMVLANAVHLKAPWVLQFHADATTPEPFHIGGGAGTAVPTMRQQQSLGYAKHTGYTAISIPYVGGELHFLILLPDDARGLSALESQLTPKMLADSSKLERHDVILHLPKLKLQPPTVALRDPLMTLGMRSAFDRPRGSANFDRMAPRQPDDYLYISQVFHQTFLEVDEKGTEAAAATAVAMAVPTSIRVDPPKPIEVKVDRPFVFAIQHGPSGACLFLGRVMDPRGGDK